MLSFRCVKSCYAFDRDNPVRFQPVMLHLRARECEGSYGIFCNELGQLKSVDCAQLGFSTCSTEGNQGLHCQ